jgi:hypothetical protein
LLHFATLEATTKDTAEAGCSGLERVFSEIGTSLYRASKAAQSEAVFAEGCRIGLFASHWQRSDSGPEFQVKGLTAKPGAYPTKNYKYWFTSICNYKNL